MKITSETVALITGGSNGIGRACAEALLQAGAGHVVLVDYDEKAGQDVLRTFQSSFGANRVSFYKIDVTNEQQLDSVFRQTSNKFGRLDIVFNNAGVGERSQLLQRDTLSTTALPSDWAATLNVNLTAVINGTRLGVREMLATKLTKKSTSSSSTSSSSSSSAAAAEPSTPVIINTASMGGLHPMPTSPVYCATKFGVVGFSRSLRYLHKQAGIRVNAICPGFTDTNMVRQAMQMNEEMAKEAAAAAGTGGGNASSVSAVAALKRADQRPTEGSLLSTADIVRAFMMLVREEKFSGHVVSISKELGIAAHYLQPMTPSQFQPVLAKL